MNSPEKRRLTSDFWATPWSAMEHSSPAKTLWRLLGRWSTGSSKATIGQAITGAAAGGPRRLMRSSRPTLLFELALEDLGQAADLLRPIHDATDATDGVDGWVLLEVWPLLANDAAGTVKVAAQLHARAQ